MTYSEIEMLVKNNRKSIIKGIDVEFFTNWNKILEWKMKEARIKESLFKIY